MMKKIIATVKHIVNLLVNGDYDEIEILSKGIRLEAEDIRNAINEYGKTFILPPDNVYDDLDVIEVEHVSPRKWSIRFDLWTKEEGRSDLSIELTLIDSGKELLTIECDDIHVL